MKNLLLLIVLSVSTLCESQMPYTTNDYGYSIETNVEYGQATNYAGQTDTLLMDIYKPIGDENCSRPCLVLVHGGSWIAGSKDDVSIVNMAKSFAEKGWVVATINYRLGTHKTASYAMYAFCNADISAPCGYIADSAEVFRANYRGQQDAKGAIRFMKERHILDSIDIDNVFIAGESAGAFVSFAATFMNNAAEKYTFCNAIANAPTPDSDLVSCLPIGYSLARPDLGDVQGTLNTGTYDASVQGVGSFYGAMMNFEMLEDETDWPAVYMFHQGSDVVVNYNYGRILGRIDWECYTPTNLCQNYARYPKAYGSKGIELYFAGLADSPDRVVDLIENYEYTGDCFDNGHSIDNWVLRSNAMAELFANRVAENGNVPDAGPCNLSISDNMIESFVSVYPNPSLGLVNFKSKSRSACHVKIYNTSGVLFTTFTLNEANTVSLQPGIYLIEMQIDNSTHYKKLIVF